MKTEQEIKSKAQFLIPVPKRKDDLDTFSYGDICKIEQNAFVYGYTQAQNDMQAELEAKDAEIAKLKAELQEAKNDMIEFNFWKYNHYWTIYGIKDKRIVYMNNLGTFKFEKQLFELYQQSKTQTK